MRPIDRLLFFKVAPRQVRYLAPLDYAGTSGLARDLIDQMVRDFVVGPPLTIHLSNPELMAGIWAMARECIAAGRERRAEGELIAAVVSRLNTCSYCYDIHAAMLHAWGATDTATALRNKQINPDPRSEAIARWAGSTLTPDASVPFPGAEGTHMISSALTFHYLNRMVNVFLDPAPFTVRNSFMIRMSGALLRPLLRGQELTAGEFLTAPAGPLPGEFAWAADAPMIAAGIARFCAAADAAGEESVPESVRSQVTEELDRWQGEKPPLGRAWPTEPVARIALMTALAGWQVDENAVSGFRKVLPRDRDLINVTAWASYQATKRIASWQKKPDPKASESRRRSFDSIER